ncbi:MAG: agmatinase [Cyanobacteria bacterium J06641_5]
MISFLGSNIQPALTPKTARVAILPVPYERTTSYRKGAQHGPEALLVASEQLELYDEQLGCEVGSRFGIYTHPPVADTRQGNPGSAADVMAAIAQATKDLIQHGCWVVALGGEHSITGAIARAYQQAHPHEPFTVVQIDAHGDLRYEYEGSIYSHACVMHRIRELGLPSLPVGIRSLSQAEAEIIAADRIPVIWAHEIASDRTWQTRAVDCIQTERVFLTIDLDGINPAAMPGVGTPEPGGLSWYGLLKFLSELFARHQVIGCDIMELAPLTDSVVSQFAAAKLTYKLIGLQAKHQQWL